MPIRWRRSRPLAMLGTATLAWAFSACGHGLHQRMDLLTQETEQLRQQNQRAISRVNELEQEVMILKDRLESSGSLCAGAAVDSKDGAVVADLDEGGNPVIKLRPPPEKASAKPLTKMARASRQHSWQQEYEMLFRKFQTGDCQETVLDFDAFAKRNPKSSLADNAQYWVGECFYRMQEFRLAIDEFLKVTRFFPQGNKAPDAMLRVGMSYAALGDPARAKQSYEGVLQGYPTSEAAIKAQSYLEGLAGQGGS